jgi:hypothetical protein
MESTHFVIGRSWVQLPLSAPDFFHPFVNQRVEISSRRGFADFESIWVQYRSYALDRNTLRLRNCVRVDVERCFYIRVAEQRLSSFDRPARFAQECCKSMAEAMPAHDRQVKSTARRPEDTVGQILRIYWRSVSTMEHQIILACAGAQPLQLTVIFDNYVLE